MTQDRDVVFAGTGANFNTQFSQQRILRQAVNVGSSRTCFKQSVGIVRNQNGQCLWQLTQLVKPHGIEPFKDVQSLSVTWQALVLFKESLDASAPGEFDVQIYPSSSLFKQAADGSVILGDSHQYADAKNIDDLGFDLDMDIDDFMIQEAKKIIDLPNYEIQNRWFGMYSQCKTKDIFEHTIENNIHIITGIGGKGMTGSAGFSKENITKIFNTKE